MQQFFDDCVAMHYSVTDMSVQLLLEKYDMGTDSHKLIVSTVLNDLAHFMSSDCAKLCFEYAQDQNCYKWLNVIEPNNEIDIEIINAIFIDRAPCEDAKFESFAREHGVCNALIHSFNKPCFNRSVFNNMINSFVYAAGLYGESVFLQTLRYSGPFLVNYQCMYREMLNRVAECLAKTLTVCMLGPMHCLCYQVRNDIWKSYYRELSDGIERCEENLLAHKNNVRSGLRRNYKRLCFVFERKDFKSFEIKRQRISSC